MISEGSGPKSLLRPPSPAAEAATYLAPGFRFHPTDEELISYYLKRKITGRPIRADAISEIDLYRAEPWDLPPRSRLRSRDLEWYFFTSLDRKYSNRCRTNRATAEGYWKTTGKDRPIQSKSRTIGMKKTLVYHAGRAPRGQRTNWVMHEYRLDDEELSRSGISQDCYVVCRVFQKNGSGPQNGAQYGAPFIEEEWEREVEGDDKPLPANVDSYEQMEPAGQDFVQLGDFLQDPNAGIQHLDSFPSEATASDNQTEGSSNFVEAILKDQDSLDDLPQEDFSASHEYTFFNMLGEKNVLEDQLNYACMHKGYVQLKDIFNGDGMSCNPKEYASHCLVEGNSLNNNGDANQLDEFQLCPHDKNEMLSQSFDHSGDVAWEYTSGQLAEDNLVYFDALCNEIPHSEDDFTRETSLTPLAEFDLLEDLISFYDTSNDSIINAPQVQFLSQSNTLNSERMPSNSSPEVVGTNILSSKEVFNVPTSLAKMSSLGKTSFGDGPSTGCNSGMSKDVKPEVYEDKTLTKRLASMLHSISAPPAFADESGLIGKTAAQIPAASGSSLHLTAGLIQIDNWTSMGYKGSWTLQKRSELGFFSYGMDPGMICKLGSHNPKNKVLSGIYSAFCRNSFLLFVVLSAVILTFSYKIGIHVCQM